MPRPADHPKKRSRASTMAEATGCVAYSTSLFILVENTAPWLTASGPDSAMPRSAATSSGSELPTATPRTPGQRYIDSSLPLSPHTSVLSAGMPKRWIANSQAFILPAWAEQKSTNFHSAPPEVITCTSGPRASRTSRRFSSMFSSTSYAEGMRYGSLANEPRGSNFGNFSISRASTAPRSKVPSILVVHSLFSVIRSGNSDQEPSIGRSSGTSYTSVPTPQISRSGLNKSLSRATANASFLLRPVE
mmetsp:Transcript_3107/g.8463  ORF Transcript_3107/g.8463 Transcript_3107/m.8463 type:complete len:247 (+) Transcript_3107:177-917(+)